MIIKKIFISGFKNVNEPQTFDLSNKVLITGDNRVGKSTIGEAIAFCFFGSSMKGETKRVEDIINTDSSEAVVEIHLSDDSGSEYAITRRKNRKDQSVAVNGVDVPQSQISQIAGDIDPTKTP